MSEISHLKQLMNQNVSDFESLVKTVNDLKISIQPKYLWMFEKLSKIKGGCQIIGDIKNQVLNMVLQCKDLSSFHLIDILKYF